MSKLCKHCYSNSIATETMDAVKKLLNKQRYICPRLDSKCGNTAMYASGQKQDSIAKVLDVFFNGRPA